ncbi:hypothetical protein B0T22DRAFT_211772 [Podospora appendiculata]|uniref:Secreted protein n=1 Tax=Podospora appendiculata TaxID=314037 RepID=A0AAE0X4J2_9PEZI|nr:hypothetical protein B0T22DRAFT_211772 [Podospora appendiculata]
MMVRSLLSLCVSQLFSCATESLSMSVSLQSHCGSCEYYETKPTSQHGHMTGDSSSASLIIILTADGTPQAI